jgi:hypothetical protein
MFRRTLPDRVPDVAVASLRLAELFQLHLRAIGARITPKKLKRQGADGGRDRDRTCDPLDVDQVLYR